MNSYSYHDFTRALEVLARQFRGAAPVPYVIGMVSTTSGKIDIFLEGGEKWSYDPDTDIIRVKD